MSLPTAGLWLAAGLTAIGLAGLIARRNLMFMLLSLELMFAGAGLAFIAAGAVWGQPDGQIMFLFVISLAGAEAAVALALILRLERRTGTLDADALRSLRG
jgi:NADH-quinone oxidoreductase subunit K